MCVLAYEKLMPSKENPGKSKGRGPSEGINHSADTHPDFLSTTPNNRIPTSLSFYSSRRSLTYLLIVLPNFTNISFISSHYYHEDILYYYPVGFALWCIRYTLLFFRKKKKLFPRRVLILNLALQVTSPGEDAIWNSTGSHTITWSSVS
jgi:hypothetical protein